MKNFYKIVLFCFSIIITEIKSNEIFQSNILSKDLIDIQSSSPPPIKNGNFSLSGVQSKAIIVPSVSSVFGTKIYRYNEKFDSTNLSSFSLGNGASNTTVSNIQFAKQSQQIISSGFIQSFGGSLSLLKNKDHKIINSNI